MSDQIKTLVDNAVFFLSSFGPISGVLLIYLESIIPILPLSVFIALNIITFGDVIGFLISLFATVLGCTTSFFFFRYFFSKKFRKFYKKDKVKQIEDLMKKLSRISFTNLTIILALPFTPAFLVNIAAGLSRMPAKDFYVLVLLEKHLWFTFGAMLGQAYLKVLQILRFY